MTVAGQPEVAVRLREWRNFEECLLHEVRWTNGLYAADVVFNYVWDSSGRVRENVLEELVLVTLRVVGVERLLFVGSLTDGMKREPQSIDWGLSEVAGVRANQEKDDLLVISVDWEGERRLEIVCVAAELLE